MSKFLNVKVFKFLMLIMDKSRGNFIGVTHIVNQLMQISMKFLKSNDPSKGTEGKKVKIIEPIDIYSTENTVDIFKMKS